MRTCPKCGDLWTPECDFCCTCGAPLVARTVMAKRPKPKRSSAGRHRQHCIYCGGMSYDLACASHRDLLTLDPGFRR